jgi:spermidine synthase
LGLRLKKRLYQGRLVYRCCDAIGPIEVVDTPTQRALHFGTRERQSAMDLQAPCSLVLSYTRAMLAGLLFWESPKTVLNVGLGGGSIPKFLAAHFPECQIDVVELREKVIQIAYRYFQLPEDPRVNLFIADIRDYLRASRLKTYDIVMLDVFDQNGLSDSVKGYTFISECKNRLNPGGLLVINLWSEPEATFRLMATSIYRCFLNQAFVLPVSDRSNRIVIGINRDPSFRIDWDALFVRSALLEERFQIGVPESLSMMYQLNHHQNGRAAAERSPIIGD